MPAKVAAEARVAAVSRAMLLSSVDSMATLLREYEPNIARVVKEKTQLMQILREVHKHKG